MSLSVVFLFSIYDIMRFDILIWVVAIPVLLIALPLSVVQFRQYKRLSAELKQLSRMKSHSIEYEMILKAMRLCVWRYDVATATMTYEHDYRDTPDGLLSYQLPVAAVLDRILPEYAEELRKGVRAVIDGVLDDFHMQYQAKFHQSDDVYWGESFATVDKRDVDGKPLTIVGTSMRIDEQKAIEQDLIDARNHAQESDRLKSAFLANISHEVRTPLNAIVGFSDVLPHIQDEEEREMLVKLIRQNNAQLLHLIDDMVNMSQLEAGRGEVKKEQFGLSDLLAEVADRYKERSAESGVKLLVQTAGEDVQLYTDRNRLREIVNQYVSNGLKFTKKGSVTIGCDQTDQHVRIWVRDTGIGIPKEYCNDSIFDSFFKIDEFVPGTGLGLSICRNLAQSLGGRIGLESELGKGSTFWVDLPVG
ncbi:MAG: HAMP domain-containing histidine kinase [Prevotella sp.]|nr:HAMP domain-containing histidine kinase [Prevotella sp.]